MSGTFKDSLAEDLESIFFNTNEFAEPVTIKRQQFSTTGVAAIVTERVYAIEGDEVRTSMQSMDFDMPASAYLVNGVVVEPAKGDRLIRADGDEFAVLPVPGGQCFEKDNDGLLLKVHTKKVA